MHFILDYFIYMQLQFQCICRLFFKAVDQSLCCISFFSSSNNFLVLLAKITLYFVLNLIELGRCWLWKFKKKTQEKVHVFMNQVNSSRPQNSIFLLSFFIPLSCFFFHRTYSHMTFLYPFVYCQSLLTWSEAPCVLFTAASLESPRT